MSLAEQVSKPSALLRLAGLLRSLPLVQFLWARLASLRGHARGESSEPASLQKPCKSPDQAPHPPSTAEPLINTAAAPRADVPMADPPVAERAFDQELSIKDLPRAAPPSVLVDQSDTGVADLELANRFGVEQSADDLREDLPQAAAADVGGPDSETQANQLTAAERPVVEQGVNDLLCDDPQLADPAVVDPLDAETSAEPASEAEPPAIEKAVHDAPVEALPPRSQRLSDEISARPDAAPELDERARREALIRRRWRETGIKMWNPDFNGAARATLNIQGCAGLLAAKPGETVSRYDTLQFRQFDHGIVCEGVVVEAPGCRKQQLERCEEPRGQS